MLEDNIARTGAVTDFLQDEHGAEMLLNSVMHGFSPKILTRNKVEYKCTCSRERFLSAILSLDKSELEDMKHKGEPIETSCQFCGSFHTFEVDEIVY